MFLGAVGGIALSPLSGLLLVPALAMGLGAMTAAMLRLPMTAVLVTTMFLGSDGFPVVVLTIVAAVVAYVARLWLEPAPAPAAPADKPAPATGMPAPRASEPRVEASPTRGGGRADRTG